MDLPPQPKTTYYQRLIDPICDLSIAAGRVICEMRDSAGIAAQMKADNSPVTAADRAANTLIVEALQRWTPEYPVVSEEGAQPDVSNAKNFWLVDPLDGTKSFIRGEDEFTVNIALIEAGRPVFGVIYLPVEGTLYYGSAAYGAYRQKAQQAPRRIQARALPAEGAVVITSQSHREAADEIVDGVVQEVLHASSSLKFCRIAEGGADIYPRHGRTMEWDTAAGQAILEAAGGQMTTLNGAVFSYGKAGLENEGFIARGKPPISLADEAEVTREEEE